LLLQTGEETMQLKTIALATAFALTSSLAFGQMGGGNAAGAEVPENSGTAVNGGGAAVGAVNNGRMTPNRSSAETTGMSRPEPSGPRTDAGGPDASRPGGQGVSRKPAD
jgi:hypothetical protein